MVYACRPAQRQHWLPVADLRVAVLEALVLFSDVVSPSSDCARISSYEKSVLCDLIMVILVIECMVFWYHTDCEETTGRILGSMVNH